MRSSRLPSREAYRALAKRLGVPTTGYRPPTYPVSGAPTPPTLAATALLQAAAAVIRAGGTPSK